MSRKTVEQQRIKATLMEEQKKEGLRCMKAFGTWGALQFAKGLTYEEQKEKWERLMAEEMENLRLKIGPAAARFAAHMKLKNKLNAKLKDGPR